MPKIKKNLQLGCVNIRKYPFFFNQLPIENCF